MLQTAQKTKFKPFWKRAFWTRTENMSESIKNYLSYLYDKEKNVIIKIPGLTAEQKQNAYTVLKCLHALIALCEGGKFTKPLLCHECKCYAGYFSSILKKGFCFKHFNLSRIRDEESSHNKN